MFKSFVFAAILAIAAAGPAPAPAPGGVIGAVPAVAAYTAGAPLAYSAYSAPLTYGAYSAPLAYSGYPAYSALPYAYKSGYYI